jgi:hypothetical protein
MALWTMVMSEARASKVSGYGNNKSQRVSLLRGVGRVTHFVGGGVEGFDVGWREYHFEGVVCVE